MHLSPEISPMLQQIVLYPLQAHGTGPVSTWDYIVNSNLFNVLLVAAILGFLIKKFNLFGGIDGQQAKIAHEIKTVETRKNEMLAQLEEAKRRTANLNGEVEEILKTAREQAEGLSAQIVADARDEAGKIVENARKRVELEQRSAMKELERRMLNDALSDARSELAQSLTAADQRRSVEAFLEELQDMKGVGR